MSTSHPADLSLLSKELTQYIVNQDYSLYTAMDHASWRYIMRVNRIFFGQHAYPKYLEGVKNTGIPIESIPRIEEMDTCLQRFGWRAVAVSGFIPPVVFLELQAMGILPIACDMRTLEHLAYTPAPDIVHEAAGHAPFIIDPEYSIYLRKYGEVARKAIFTAEDLEVYEAVRHLSIVKEDPATNESDLNKAQARLDCAIAASTYVSEATLLGRMAWWSTEYGLIQEGDQPLIFGAGILSSVGESFNCLSDHVAKIPFTIDSIHVAFDITRPQPQLFVTPNFATLTHVLDELSAQMAFRRGGYEGLAKAKMAKTPTTTVLDSGLQISGTLSDVFFNHTHGPYFVKFTGPTQLAYRDEELPGQGAHTHHHGFSSPIGLIKGLVKSASELTMSELAHFGFVDGKKGVLPFASGLILEGIWVDSCQRNGRSILLSFEECTIRDPRRGQILYQPEWGRFDLACGATVTSVFGGAADRPRYFEAIDDQNHSPGQPKTNLTEHNRQLNIWYARVREIREQNSVSHHIQELQTIATQVAQTHPQDWLLTLELVELLQTPEPALAVQLQRRLDQLAAHSLETANLIARGLEVLKQSLT
jgi:phenylalanine-4-hydroxylase